VAGVAKVDVTAGVLHGPIGQGSGGVGAAGQGAVAMGAARGDTSCAGDVERDIRTFLFMRWLARWGVVDLVT